MDEIDDVELFDWISNSTIGWLIFEQLNETSLNILSFIEVEDFESCSFEMVLLEVEMQSWQVILALDLDESTDRINEILHIMYNNVLAINREAIKQK